MSEPSERTWGIAARPLVALGLGLVVLGVLAAMGAPDRDPSPDPVEWPTAAPDPDAEEWVDPASAGHPWGDEVAGILTFRGNPTRSWYGGGPVPTDPVEVWSYPDAPMCSESEVEQGEHSGTFNWCGTGWTGQPALFEHDDRTWVVFGAYDKAIHFVDADTGDDLLAPFATGDIIKGSVTVDPDGFPLVYSGSRDDKMHILAFDGDEARELWTFDADEVDGLWNDDWDASPLIIDDHLFQVGENSWWFVWKLNRAYDADGRVTVDPELVFEAPGWDDELLDDLGDEQVSIENSIAISGDVAYFANSGGLVQGWDIAPLRTGEGEPERVFRFWTGDDTDASIVIDDEGYLYVASQYERMNEREAEVGQVVKLDPTRADDPIVWRWHDPDRRGIWATPAIQRDILVVATDGGRVLGLDRATGEERWEMFLRGPTWQSPVVVDDVLIQGDCRGGVLRGFDVSDTHVAPPQVWAVELGGCVESTPAVWDGRIVVGTRGGFVHALEQRDPAPIVVPPRGD